MSNICTTLQLTLTNNLIIFNTLVSSRLYYYNSLHTCRHDAAVSAVSTKQWEASQNTWVQTSQKSPRLRFTSKITPWSSYTLHLSTPNTSCYLPTSDQRINYSFKRKFKVNFTVTFYCFSPSAVEKKKLPYWEISSSFLKKLAKLTILGWFCKMFNNVVLNFYSFYLSSVAFSSLWLIFLMQWQ